MNSAHEAGTRLTHSAAYFDVIAARKIELLVVEPPWHVHVHAAGAILVVSRVILHRGDVSGNSCACCISDVFANRAARIRESLRKSRAPRIE